MHRRTALQRLAVILGGISLTPELMANTLARATNGDIPSMLGPNNVAILAEMAELIIPETDTPGAKAANVHNFIALLVEDCLSPADRTAFWAGLEKADKTCQSMHGKSFMDCNTQQRTALLTRLEKESQTEKDPSFWRMLKSMTLFGYFSSEIGMTQALNYDPIPGGWIPDMKIDDNTKAWASMF